MSSGTKCVAGPLGAGETRGSVAAVSRSFHVPALDGLRAIAFLLVFFAHSGLDKVVPGGFGVTVFFFLSGYLITTLLRIEASKTGRISLRDFYLRRCRRIFPPLYITLALGYLLALLGVLAGRGTLNGALSTVFFYFNYHELGSGSAALPTGLNVVWSIMVEEHFYFVFPFIYLLLLSRGIARVKQAKVLAVICLLPLAWRSILVFAMGMDPLRWPQWTYYATDARFDSILWGCVFALAFNPWFEDLPSANVWNRRKGWFALAGLAMLFGTLVFRNPQFRESLRYSLQSLALFPIFYYCIATRKHWTIAWLENHWLGALGRISYAAYLVHFVLLLTLPRYVNAGYPVVTGLAFAMCVAYGVLMRICVEDPMRKLGKKARPASAERPVMEAAVHSPEMA